MNVPPLERIALPKRTSQTNIPTTLEQSSPQNLCDFKDVESIAALCRFRNDHQEKLASSLAPYGGQ
jgi:hypothetical protein